MKLNAILYVVGLSAQVFAIILAFIFPSVFSLLPSLFLLLLVGGGLLVIFTGRRLSSAKPATESSLAFKREKRRFYLLAFSPLALLVFSLLVIPSYYGYLAILYIAWGGYLSLRLVRISRRLREEAAQESRSKAAANG